MVSTLHLFEVVENPVLSKGEIPKIMQYSWEIIVGSH